MATQGSAEFARCQQFEQQRQDLIAITPGQGEGELGVQQTIANPDVVSSSGSLEGEVPLPSSELSEGG
jgi:hypothetical protein